MSGDISGYVPIIPSIFSGVIIPSASYGNCSVARISGEPVSAAISRIRSSGMETSTGQYALPDLTHARKHTGIYGLL